MLDGALPNDLQLWLCEWDMLLAEGQAFASRLEKLGKNVSTHIIPRVPHGWDKSPNPFRDQHAIDLLYEKAAKGMDEVFKSDDGMHTRASSINEGLVGRQPRRTSVFMPM
jgi:acetyl esterase/lipase